MPTYALTPSAPIPGYTLASVTLALSRLVQNTISSTATGGSATTLVDTTRSEPSDHFNQGTLWPLSGTHSGKSVVITDYDATTYTFTFPTLTTAIASGVLYAAGTADYPKASLIEAINMALYEIGPLPSIDVSLTTVEDQEDYTLPTGVYNIKKVELALNSTIPYGYVEHFGWHEIDGKIRFLPGRAPADTGYKLRLTYALNDVTDLSADTDIISDYIHRDVLIWMAAVHAHRRRIQRSKGDEPTVTILMNEAIARAEQIKRLHPIPKVSRSPILAGY